MNTPISIDSSLELLTSGRATTVAACDCTNPSVGRHFKEILADENLLPEVMAKLKEALPEEIYAQIEEMVDSGNVLPLAAIFPVESPLFQQNLTGFPQIVQDAFKQDGGQISTIVAAALDEGEKRLQKLGSSMGSNISDVLSQTSEKGGGLGKHIQDLLVAAKAELAAADSGQKIFPIPVSDGDSSVTTATAIGTAINGLAQLSNFQAAGGLSMPPPAISAPLGDPAWGQAMGERIMWMMGKGVQGASIRINPPELGPIQVQISVKNDQTNVHMLVQHGVVKEALDAAMPRLRDMLGESNLQLVNVDVSHRESPNQSSSSGLFSHDQREQMEQFLHDQELTAKNEEDMPRYYRSTGLLDDYA